MNDAAAAGEVLLIIPIVFLRVGRIASFDYIYDVLGMTFSGESDVTALKWLRQGAKRALASAKYHGKEIPFSFFRSTVDDYPNTDLLRFQYAQCCMNHFRGYSAGMDIPRKA